MSKKVVFSLAAVLLLAAALLSACGTKQVDIGIVFPTREEPRWIQDETRFEDALKNLDYEAEILFSQGDSAKEKANVEDLITKGVKSSSSPPTMVLFPPLLKLREPQALK